MEDDASGDCLMVSNEKDGFCSFEGGLLFDDKDDRSLRISMTWAQNEAGRGLKLDFFYQPG